MSKGSVPNLPVGKIREQILAPDPGRRANFYVLNQSCERSLGMKTYEKMEVIGGSVDPMETRLSALDNSPNVPEEAVTTAFNQHLLSIFGGEDNVIVDLGEGGQANPLCTAWATPGGSMGCGKRLLSTG